MILLSTGSLYTYGLHRVFGLAAEAGYDGIEVIVDDRADTWQADYLARLSSEFGLPIAVVHSPFRLQLPDWPDSETERIPRALRLAEAVAADTLVVHLPARWGFVLLLAGRQRWTLPALWQPNRRVIAWFEDELPQRQSETKVRIAVEIMPLMRVLGRSLNAYAWNTLSEWPRFAHLTLDTTHCATWGIDPRVAFDRANGRVSHIHLSNYDGQEHRLPQSGHLSLDGFLRHVAAAGYEGHITIETGPDAMQAQEVGLVQKNLTEALAFSRRHLAER